jgi:membrane protein YdbS with pleckstrin-like domain
VWIRIGIGVVLCLVGAVWIAQGSGAMHGSMMTGHGQYAALGVVVVIGGLVLIGLSVRRRGRKPL